MHRLLQEGKPPRSVVFLTGEVIDDHHALIRIVQDVLEQMPALILKYILIDEITYIKGWDKGIKFLADVGILDDVILVLTGSDLVLMKEACARFPGRRGQADQVDYTLYPLSFHEVVHLCFPDLDKEDISGLCNAFNAYLIHGGYLTAINDQAETGSIRPATYRTYADWIRGDFLKRGKSEESLRDFLKAVFKTYGTQISWIALTHHTAIAHPHTLQDYAETMASMEALFIQSALLEDKLTAAPKKAKKLYFADPFIYHALAFWLQIPLRENWEPALVETVVINHIRRHWPTYYIKAEGEVDIAYIKEGRFFPIEIKWTQQLRPKDFKQIQKYPQGLILSKTQQDGFLGPIPTKPLPRFLYDLK
ncbi:MAG: ATP-binding protein [Proteobacteria bacterium]|nr:ATP-binding protein [Pseudomonadota bacterium]